MENLLKTEGKYKKSIKDSELKRMFKELVVNDTEEEKVMNDLFYKSVKMVFDTGFHLAKELNEDLLADTHDKNI
ncbi:MAG: hypothetical protein ACFFBP_21720 [Promethearchaeota archaeon]